MASPCEDPTLRQKCAERILNSQTFARSPQARRFLTFVVERTLQGQADNLKAYTIGVTALGVHPERSSPETTARMQASRVRKLLFKYYQIEGRSDPIELQLPPGLYEPRFMFRTRAGEAPRPQLKLQDFSCHSDHALDAQLCTGLTGALLRLFVKHPGLEVVSSGATTPSSGSFVLCGTVSRVGETVRVDCQLKEPEEDRTTWADCFDLRIDAETSLTQIDAVAKKIACRVGDPALGALPQSFGKAVTGSRGPSADVALYKFLSEPQTSHFETALSRTEDELRKTSVPANVHAAYSILLSLESLRHHGRKNELLTAEVHGRRAVEEDSRQALSHLAAAFIHYRHHETACARREIDRCLELDPSGAIHPAVCGLLLAWMGHFEEGLELLDEAESRAGQLPGYFNLIRSLYFLHVEGRVDEALALARTVDAMSGLWENILTAACYRRLGNLAEARRTAARIASLAPALSKAPLKYLKPWFFVPEVAEELAQALTDAGLGSPSRRSHTRETFKVSLSRRSEHGGVCIGILQSLSGTMALSEAPLVNAAMLAVEELNRTGGVLGRPVRALVEDGASDPAHFRRKAERLVQTSGVTSIFGCWTSSSRKAVLPVVEQADALLWYPMQYEGLEKSRRVIYTGSCLNQQIEPAVRWALQQGMRRAFVIGSDYVFPRTANRLIRALVEGGGGQVIGEEYHPLGRGDFWGSAKAIGELAPDIVFNTVNGADNVRLFEALARAGVSATKTPVMSFSLSEIELSKCNNVADGHLACWSYFQSLDGEENRQLVARFHNRYGEGEILADPVVTAHAQVHLWRTVVERAGTLKTDAVLSHLPGSKMSLGGLEVELLDNHHVVRPAAIGRARSGNFEVLWRSPGTLDPLPWLGVDRAEFSERDLILGALQALPELAEKTSSTERAPLRSGPDVTRRHVEPRERSDTPGRAGSAGRG